eukprot:GSChrysophyteH1.ASY1.ANO1.1542.1 assembled CDS
MKRHFRVLKRYANAAVFMDQDSLPNSSCLYAQLLQSESKGEIRACSRNELPGELGRMVHDTVQFEEIFGIYHLLAGTYVALVEESEAWVSVSGLSIRRAKKISMVPIFTSPIILSERQQQDDATYLSLLQRAFDEHDFFYSHEFDLTHTQQRIAKFQKSKFSKECWRRADLRFFWNFDVISDLLSCVTADEWVVPFMNGYIEFQPDCVIDAHKFSLLFLSRRSRYHQGCRFIKRGVDPDGNVANFVETEQLVIFPDGALNSYVQTRGSIPIVWQSFVHMKYAPEVKIDVTKRSEEFALAHVQSLLQNYEDNLGRAGVLFVNLIDSNKEQGMLGKLFRDCIDNIQRQVPSRQHANLQNLIPKVDGIFHAQKYFSKTSEGVVTSWQVGCIRTNCMDNLDRTNVVQSLFARRSILKQLGKLEKGGNDALNSPYKTFETIFKSVWANNANAISKLYAGTGALKVDFTKTGKKTYKGDINDGVNSCKRYYFNNFTDGVKQDSIDLMLGRYQPHSALGRSPFLGDPNHEDFNEGALKVTCVVFLVFLLRILFSSEEHLDIEALKTCMQQSALISCLLLMVFLYVLVKKGSALGKRFVVRNKLVPDMSIK